MMQTTETIWQNGKLIPWADAKIHVLSHTLHYGGGAFEGIRFYISKVLARERGQIEVKLKICAQSKINGVQKNFRDIS
jgi:hypothetical protein